jgi:uncharacterized oxidoreductase
MKLEGNTILITGGSSGIGLKAAEYFVKKGNTVIICGRVLEKLESAKKRIPSLHILQCDISIESECKRLFNWIKESFPDCNVLINNAAVVHKTNFLSDDQIIAKAELEIKTNYFAPIILSKLFIPMLERAPNSGIIYITTGLVYSPKAAYPIYCSTKAGLHSFIQTLRIQMKVSPLKITEVVMPAVDTPFHDGSPPKIAITVDKAMEGMINGLKKEDTEIRVGGAKLIYRLSRLAPSFTLKKINEM